MIKVLGIGSPFGDDQAGLKVIDALEASGITYPNVVLMRCDRPGMRLLELMNGAQQVLLIDAVKTGHPKGTIHRLEGDDIQSLNAGYSTHHVGIVEALAIGKALNQCPDDIVLYGIEIEDITIDERLSLSVEKAVAEVVLSIQSFFS